jgi:tRNA/rRNA methyltransferase
MRDRVKVEGMRELSRGPLAGLSVVLVETRNPMNIGAVARAMANFGLSRLVLVRPRAFPHPEATRMAAGGIQIVRRAEVFAELSQALEGHHLALAFTRREGKMRRPFLALRDAAPRALRTVASGGRAALVFGREDHGLSNDDLRACPEVVVIPTDPACASLNLAQAVALAAYEIFAEASRGLILEPLPLATLAQTEELLEHWQRALLRVGFTDPKRPERIRRYFERLFARCALTRRDVRVLRGLAHQMEWAAGAEAASPPARMATGATRSASGATAKRPRSRRAVV